MRRLRPGRTAAAALPAAWTLAASSTALAQHLGQAGDDGVSAWRVLGAFIFSSLAALGVILFMRRRMGAGAGANVRPLNWASLRQWIQGLEAAAPVAKRLTLAEVVRVSHQTDLCLLDCEGRAILIAVHPQGVTLLRDSQAAPDLAP